MVQYRSPNTSGFPEDFTDLNLNNSIYVTFLLDHSRLFRCLEGLKSVDIITFRSLILGTSMIFSVPFNPCALRDARGRCHWSDYVLNSLLSSARSIPVTFTSSTVMQHELCGLFFKPLINIKKIVGPTTDPQGILLDVPASAVK